MEKETPELFEDDSWNKLVSSSGLTLITGTRSFEDEATLRATLEKIVEKLQIEAVRNGLTPWTTDSLADPAFSELELGTKELGIFDRSGVIMPVTDPRMQELSVLAQITPIVLVCQRPPSLPAQRKPYSIVEVRFVAEPTPSILLVQVKNREAENAPEMLFDAVTGDLTELSQLGDPDCCADLEDEDEADSIKSLADKLATLNQRLIPGQEKEALELAKLWLADPKRDDVNLAVTLASAGVSECTAKEARKEKKGVLWKLSAKFDAEYFAHIRPEYVARCETGIPITLEERKEMRGNSWEVAYLARHLDDGALLSAAKYAGDNSRICLSLVTRWEVPITYDDSVFMLYLPLLIERVEKLRQHNALMREELIRLASSPAVKGEVEMMRILSIADNVAVEMAERAIRFDTDKATFVELAPPMPGPYSGGDTNPEASHIDTATLRSTFTMQFGSDMQHLLRQRGFKPETPHQRQLRLQGCGDEEHGRGGQHQHVCAGCDNCNDAPARKEYTRAEEEAWARTLQDAGVVTRNTQDDLHSPGCVSPENHNGPCPTGGFVKPSGLAQLSLTVITEKEGV